MAKITNDEAKVYADKYLRGKDTTSPDAKPTAKEPLKGCYFHKIKDHKLVWQGVVLRQFDQYVLVLTFEWAMGAPSVQYLIPISDLAWNDDTKTGYYLYDYHDMFLFSYDYGNAHAAHNRNVVELKQTEADRQKQSKAEAFDGVIG